MSIQSLLSQPTHILVNCFAFPIAVVLAADCCGYPGRAACTGNRECEGQFAAEIFRVASESGLQGPLQMLVVALARTSVTVLRRAVMGNIVRYMEKEMYLGKAPSFPYGGHSISIGNRNSLLDT